MSIDTERIFVAEDFNIGTGSGDDRSRYARRTPRAQFPRRTPAAGGTIAPQYTRGSRQASRLRSPQRERAPKRERMTQAERIVHGEPGAQLVTPQHAEREPRAATQRSARRPDRPARRTRDTTTVRRRGGRGWFWLLMATIVVVGVAGVLVLNTKINENSFRLGDLHDSQAELTVQEQQLSQQLADLESPGNLRKAATDLGLVPAESVSFVLDLPGGREVTVPNPGGR